jgi:hypothetical protein
MRSTSPTVFILRDPLISDDAACSLTADLPGICGPATVVALEFEPAAMWVYNQEMEKFR